ncbi:MAG TPA: hypothetical protein VFY28_01590 [Candidatus Paceibacterota bacterium]|nr:hypothetical protein [Candidatus Paceibacterota bacterium]
MAQAPQSDGSLFKPLTGDDSGSFDLFLVQDALLSLETRLANTAAGDDFIFQSHLRYLAALYYFLGGRGFVDTLSHKLSIGVGPVKRWMNGASAPISGIREKALSAAIELVRGIEQRRQSGATLSDITSSYKK